MRQILQPSSASSLFYKYIPSRRKTSHLALDPDHRREGSGYQVRRIPLLLSFFFARPADAVPRQLSAHALVLFLVASRAPL
jgi:hypothetical protein